MEKSKCYREERSYFEQRRDYWTCGADYAPSIEDLKASGTWERMTEKERRIREEGRANVLAQQDHIQKIKKILAERLKESEERPFHSFW